MEDLDEQTIAELKSKAIERGDDDDITTNEIDEELKEPLEVEPDLVKEEEPVKEVKKPKRQRSEKQKAAFEKARLKRAENLKIKKQIEAEKKQKQKEEKELVKKQVKERLAQKETIDLPPPQEVNNILNTEQRYKEVYGEDKEQPRYREQVVNNYYYYGTPPPQAQQYYEPGSVAYGDPTLREPPVPASAAKPKRGRQKKVVVKEPEPETESESEEEIIYSDPEEPQSYKELQNFDEEVERQSQPKQNNGLKFRFA